MCRDAFFALVDDGRVESVNGLAVASDYSAFYVTAWAPGEEGQRARLEAWRCRSGDWRADGPVFENTQYSDYQPVLSQDGNRLYFTSTRPLSGSGAAVRQNPWIAERNADGHWSLRPLVSLASEWWDGHTVEIGERHVLFASERPGGAGMVDLYEARLDGAEVHNAVALNSAASDNDMTYDMHIGVLVFARYEAESGDINLFVSRRLAEEWVQPIPITELNTAEWESSPMIAPGGRQLLFKRGDGPIRRAPLIDIIRFE